MKFPKVVVPLMAAAALVGVGFNAPPIFDVKTTPDVQGQISYVLTPTPKGFTQVSDGSSKKYLDLISKQNPTPIKNTTGTCKFTEQIVYLPSYTAGRGDSYLTKEYIYDNSQVSKSLPTKLESQRITSNQGLIETLYSSYAIPAPDQSSKSQKGDISGYYRTVAVRAFDKVSALPDSTPNESKGAYGSDATKGIPAIVMVYDCDTVAEFNIHDFKKLLSTVRVNIPARSDNHKTMI